MFVIRSSTAFMSAQIVGQSGGVPQLRRLFSWRRAPARMDSESEIEIVERTPPPPRLRSLFPSIVWNADKDTENLAHVKACKDKYRGRCLSFRNSEKWQHKLPIAQDEFQAEASNLEIVTDEKYTTESWLDDRVDSKTGTWGARLYLLRSATAITARKTEERRCRSLAASQSSHAVLL